MPPPPPPLPPQPQAYYPAAPQPGQPAQPYYPTAPQPPQPPQPYFPSPAVQASSSPLVLDCIVTYEYRGHHGRSHEPQAMQGAERRLRITIDDTRTANSIKDEVLARKEIIPAPYQYLGALLKSQGGFELGENDLVRYIAARGENVRIEIHYRKDASKGYHAEKAGCAVA